MRSFIAEALDVSMENVDAMVLGGHGDTMVPLPASRRSPASRSPNFFQKRRSRRSTSAPQRAASRS